jgi:hypothetical protein
MKHVTQPGNRGDPLFHMPSPAVTFSLLASSVLALIVILLLFATSAR